MAQAKSNKEIADELFVGEDAIKHILCRIYERLGYRPDEGAVYRVRLAVEYWSGQHGS